MKRIMLVPLYVVGALSASLPALAAEQMKAQQVQFQKGKSEKTIMGSIIGDQAIDYKLMARKGQKMTVVLDTQYNTYFNVLAPGSDAEAIFYGASKGDRFEGMLPAKGNYTLRVYQLGADKESKAKHPFKLHVKIE
ncbi:MAG: hypothetical protein ACRCWB_06260 [Enterovibrio sp.]